MALSSRETNSEDYDSDFDNSSHEDDEQSNQQDVLSETEQQEQRNTIVRIEKKLPSLTDIEIITNYEYLLFIIFKVETANASFAWNDPGMVEERTVLLSTIRTAKRRSKLFSFTNICSSSFVPYQLHPIQNARDIIDRLLSSHKMVCELLNELADGEFELSQSLEKVASIVEKLVSSKFSYFAVEFISSIHFFLFYFEKRLRLWFLTIITSRFRSPQ